MDIIRTTNYIPYSLGNGVIIVAILWPRKCLSWCLVSKGSCSQQLVLVIFSLVRFISSKGFSTGGGQLWRETKVSQSFWTDGMITDSRRLDLVRFPGKYVEFWCKLEHCRDMTTGPFIIVIGVRKTWSQKNKTVLQLRYQPLSRWSCTIPSLMTVHGTYHPVKTVDAGICPQTNGKPKTTTSPNLILSSLQ